LALRTYLNKVSRDYLDEAAKPLLELERPGQGGGDELRASVQGPDEVSSSYIPEHRVAVAQKKIILKSAINCSKIVSWNFLNECDIIMAIGF
jgi:hypothetical protein